MRSKAEMLGIVADLFVQCGYNGTTMREVAQALEMREIHLYPLLGTKENMLWEIVARIGRLFLTQARSVPRSISPAEQLHLLIYRHLEVVAQDRAQVQVFLHDWKFLGAEQRDEIQVMRETYDSYFYRVIEAGVKEGIFQVADTLLACLLVLSALHWTHQWFSGNDAFTFVRLADQYSMLLMRTLCLGYDVSVTGALPYLYTRDEQPE